MAKARRKVGFSTIFYPVAMGRYLLEALRRRKDIEVFTAGPFTGNWIPWKGGMYLPPSYVFTPDFAVPFAQPPMLNYGDTRLKEKTQDVELWIEANAGLVTAGRPECKYVVVGTDPHVLDYSAARKKADHFFSMQRAYRAEGDLWLPYGYDPVWHSPTTIGVAAREYDASLIGLQYPQRIQLIQRLNGLGLKTFFDTGPAYEDAREVYHNTKVGLHWASLKDTAARVFEIMAFGIAPVLNRVPDLCQMFKDGRDFYGFDNTEEAIACTLILSKDLLMCEDLGAAACRAVKPHTWDARIDQLLGEVKFL